MERTKQKYVPPTLSVDGIEMEKHLLQGSTTQGSIHQYVYEENAWGDEEW